MRIALILGTAVFFGASRLCVGELTIHLNDDNFFLLQGSGEQLAGLDLISPGGGLVPATDGASPFQFMLSNKPQQITYANLGQTVTVDGTMLLSAGWNGPPQLRDLTAVWGNGPTPVSIPIPASFYQPCVTCPPPLPPRSSLLSFSVNADQQLVVSGRGQEISDLTFTSASQSLVPPTSAGMFESLVVGDTGTVKLSSTSAVTIDGKVTLGVGWSDHAYKRDVSYEYTIFGAETVGPKALRSFDYDYDFKRFPALGVSVNEDYQIVIRGEGHPITELSLSSRSNSLETSENLGPFSSFASNSASRVTYSSPSVITIDGALTLGTSWKPRGREDITIQYELLNDLADGNFSVHQDNYPEVPAHVIAGVEPIFISLDDQNRFVITGSGQQINGIDFKSATGALKLSGNETSPFPLILSNKPTQVTLGILGDPAEILGSYTLDFGPTSADVLDQIQIDVGYGVVPVAIPANFFCDTCGIPNITVSDGRELVFRDFSEKITELRFTSTEGGLESLVMPEGITLTTSTANEVVINSPEGFGPETLAGLAVAWGISADQNVFVSFTLLNGAKFGPIPLSLGENVPEPAAGLLLMLGLLPLLKMRRSHMQG